MTRRAVVSYPVDAAVQEKRLALFEGIRTCAAELIELGTEPIDVVAELEQVANDAEQSELT